VQKYSEIIKTRSQTTTRLADRTASQYPIKCLENEFRSVWRVVCDRSCSTGRWS